MKIVTKNTAMPLIVLALLACACASPPKVRVDKDASINFANYKTFAWLAPQKEPVKEPVKPVAGKDAAPAAEKETSPEAKSLVENRVRTAVVAALQGRGYSLNETTPDFRVSYVFNMYERPKDSGFRIGLGAGGGTGRVGGGVGLSIPIGKRTNMMGAMTIDIIDAARNTQVWTGSYETKVDDDVLTDTDANTLVTTILARFPIDAAKK